jgi:hypothetical protein
MSGENENNGQPTEPTQEPTAPPAVTPPSEPPADKPTLTQAQVDAILKERLGRERAKFADYDDLKAAKAKLEEIETAQLTELEQAQKRADDAERQAQQALQTSQDRLIRAEFTAVAATKGAAHPGDAYHLADLSGVTLTESGDVSGVTEAVEELLSANRLVLTGKPKPPDMNGGDGGGDRQPPVVRLSPDEEYFARALNISPEQYAKRKRKK